ncbi:MAG: hypothetical protein QM630_07580 [Microbacterium sp.]
MLHSRRLPDEFSRGAFRYGDAVSAGIARSRLNAADVRHPHHGVYAGTGADDPLERRCRELAIVFSGSRVFSHLTAARLWGMPMPFAWSEDEDLHTIAHRGAAPIRRPGVVGWETERDLKMTTHRGVLLTQPAETWCQLAMPGATGVDESGRRRSLSRDWLVAAAEYLLTGPKVDGVRTPLCAREHLIAALARHRGKRGVKAARQALELVRTPVHSPRETLLRLLLVDQGLPEPEVQFAVVTADGIRHADLGYRAARLLIEYQGDHHRTDQNQWREDLTRIQLFQDAGYDVICVGADDIAPPNRRRLVERIRRALSRRTTRETSQMS